MKKDIRVGFKNKVKKTVEGVDAVEFSARSSGEVSQLRREIHAEIIKKLALEEDRSKIEVSCFLFSEKIRFGRSLRFGC